MIVDPDMPQGYQMILQNDALIIYQLSFVDDIPELEAAITVCSDHSVVVTIEKKKCHQASIRVFCKAHLQHSCSY